MTFQGRVVEWINQIIAEENLQFDRADQELLANEGRRPDIVIWERRKTKPALLLELKQPFEDPWGAALDDAISKAWRKNIPYIATWNVNRFYSWETFGSGDIFDKLWFPHSGVRDEVAHIKRLEEVDAIEDSIKSFLLGFLKEFAEVYLGMKPKPPLATDERFILRLRSSIDALSIPVFYEIKGRCKGSDKFRKELGDWFTEQGWSFTGSDDDMEKFSRQYVYLLIDKIMFYNVLRIKYPILRRISMPTGVEGEQFKNILQQFFDAALEIDYETIFSTNFLDSVPIPNDSVSQLREFVDRIGKYDFSKVSYDILGRVFERLIPMEERHKVGQYFTSPDVVDLISAFCVRNPRDVILDPACGAFTFGVRSYYRKKYFDPSIPHGNLLEDLYGIDIAKFPAHLATINMATRDLSARENYPKVIRKDFFDVVVGDKALLVPTTYLTKGLGRKEFEVTIPRFNAVIMNPPYTRQEEMEDIFVQEKKKAHQICLKDWKNLSIGKYTGKRLPHLSKRSSIYAYFFIHGASFLKNDGFLGLITSNSWLDVAYGYDLQRFFLENFEIEAIVGSKVERWFVDADINTVITILRRQKKQKKRAENIVRFVQLKKPLAHFIPSTSDEKIRWKAVDKLIKMIKKSGKPFEDEVIRIFPIKQQDLEKQGIRGKTKEYVGLRWSRYIRAPSVFFQILKKSGKKLVPLDNICRIQWGSLKTGADKFFYLDKNRAKKLGIEKRFLTRQINGKIVPNYVIKSPRESDSIIVNPDELKYMALMIHEDRKKLKGTNASKYILHGEREGYHRRPTCSSRKKWYDLGPEKRAPILWPGGAWTRHIAFYNKPRFLADRRLFNIYPKTKDETEVEVLCAILNSTITALFSEIYGKTVFGQGLLLADVYAVEKIPVLDPRTLDNDSKAKIKRAFEEISKRKVGNVFEELGAKEDESVSLDSVRPDRGNLDKIIFEILGLSEEERLAVYRQVISLVKSRVKRARSVQRLKRTKGIAIKPLIESLLKEIDAEIGRFPEDYVSFQNYTTMNIPKGAVKIGSDLDGFYVTVGNKEIRCKSALHAKYIKYASLSKREIRIPNDRRILKQSVRKFDLILKKAISKMNDSLNKSIPDRKLRKKIRFEVINHLT